jgi:hypothetical protein
MSWSAKQAADWQELLRMAAGAELVVERVALPERQMAIEGHFTLPELARLSLEDQVFVAAFVRSHGSIKEMEQVFGVSYPTIKTRLNKVAAQLEFVDVNPPDPAPKAATRTGILEQLNRGEIDAAEAVRLLEALA